MVASGEMSVLSSMNGKVADRPTEVKDQPQPASGASTLRKARARLNEVWSRGGLFYLLLYGTRLCCQLLLDWFDGRLVRIEQSKCVVEPWTISARRFTVAENKFISNNLDWSRHGEEWTPSADWKEEVIREWMLPHFPQGGTFVEIGPGGGRWTETLQRLADHLVVVDIGEMALSVCRKRFADYDNIEYLLGDGRTIAVPDSFADAIWSYDVFVHISPLDVRAYFREIQRVLRPGGYAVIHHAGPPIPGVCLRKGWRSDLTDQLVLRFAEENGLEVVNQTTRLVNPGDVLTIVRKQG
jgi:2-polyprenyl-3-methyl-5-hydroxy-6-metoxy-1,4-benzoquinol methylase